MLRQVGLITVCSEGEAHYEEVWGNLSKKVLERTYYRTWDLVGGFGGGAKEAGICSRLEIGRCQKVGNNSLTGHLNKSSL